VRRLIPDNLNGSEAVRIATEIGCKIEPVADTGELRLSHPLIGRSIKIRPETSYVGRVAVSFLREIAGLHPPKSR